MKKGIEKGLSLVEILIVITIFSVLGVLITQSVILTLTGSRKSEATIRVRENLDYSLNVIERQLRNASAVYRDSTYTTACNSSVQTSIYYLDQNGNKSYFSCENIDGVGSYIASGSAHLTGSAVKIVACSFQCVPNALSNPNLVRVKITLNDGSTTGVNSASASASTQIYLRNY